MKHCTNCGAVLQDHMSFCTTCGTSQNPNPAPAPVYAPHGYVPADPYDHTHEFDPKDISDNKVVCMLMYLAGYVGILVALLMSNSSKYVAFHLRQVLKFEVATILVGILGAIGAIIIIGPFLAGIAVLVLTVIRIICFFQICEGKAKEPAIIRDLKFLK